MAAEKIQTNSPSVVSFLSAIEEARDEKKLGEIFGRNPRLLTETLRTEDGREIPLLALLYERITVVSFASDEDKFRSLFLAMQCLVKECGVNSAQEYTGPDGQTTSVSADVKQRYESVLSAEIDDEEMAYTGQALSALHEYFSQPLPALEDKKSPEPQRIEPTAKELLLQSMLEKSVEKLRLALQKDPTLKCIGVRKPQPLLRIAVRYKFAAAIPVLIDEFQHDPNEKSQGVVNSDEATALMDALGQADLESRTEGKISNETKEAIRALVKCKADVNLQIHQKEGTVSAMTYPAPDEIRGLLRELTTVPVVGVVINPDGSRMVAVSVCPPKNRAESARNFAAVAGVVGLPPPPVAAAAAPPPHSFTAAAASASSVQSASHANSETNRTPSPAGRRSG